MQKTMRKNDVQKRIEHAIEELNAMDNKVYFEFVETEYSVKLICQSRTKKGTEFGAYSFTGMFDDYAEKLNAYEDCMLFAEMMIAATKLNDPAAYHNFCF